MKRLWLGFALATLAACEVGNSGVARFVPDHADRYSREYLALVARGAIDTAELRFAREIPHDSARIVLRYLHERLRSAELDSAELVGAYVSSTMLTGGGTVTDRRVAYLVPTDSAWVHVVLAMSERNNVRSLTGLHVNNYTVDPRLSSRFTFSGKPVAQYLFILFGIGCALGALATAVWVARQKGFPRRWLWVPVSLLGVGTASLDWSTGAFARSLLDIQLLCFSAVKSGPMDPWVFGLAFPAGAVLAVSRVRAWRALRAPAPLTPITPS